MIDRSRITRLICNSRRLDSVTLNPCDNAHDRQNVIRKLIAEAVRSSDRRSVLVLVIEQ